MSMLEQVVGAIVFFSIVGTFIGLLIWALVNLRKPDPKLQQQYDFAKIREPRIVEMQPKRRIIEAPIDRKTVEKGISAISGIR
jgi:hypothetical protein